MKINLTWTITTIIAICAFMSPIFVSIINNRYKLKMKKIDVERQNHKEYLDHKRKLIDSFFEDIAPASRNEPGSIEALNLIKDSYRLRPYVSKKEGNLYSAVAQSFANTVKNPNDLQQIAKNMSDLIDVVTKSMQE